MPKVSKVGIDDFLAAGHTINEAKALSRKFEPQDLGCIRLSRDARLRDLIKDLWDTFWKHEFKGIGEHSARDVFKVLIDTATKSSKPHEDGVRVTIARRTLAMKAKVSTRTLTKSITRLEDAGLAYRDNEGRKADKSGGFVLRATVPQLGEDGGQEEKVSTLSKVYDPGGVQLRAPRLRWSRPKFTPRRGLVRGTRKVRQGSKLKPRDRIERLGKIRGAIVDVLEAAGGSATLQEIADALHRKRPRDIRRRNLPMLEEAGIVTVEEDLVKLAPAWLEALDNARELGGEQEAEELDRKRYVRQRKVYHAGRTIEPDPAPTEQEMQEFRASAPHRRRRAIEQALARLFAESPECRARSVGQITCRLLFYLDESFPRGGPDGAPKDAEIEAILDGGEVVEDASEPDPPPAEECESHPLDCECDDCLIPEPRYARPYTGIAGAA
jgi:ribosomal protein S19E (S16A)